MDTYKKFIRWFNSRPHWQQIVLIALLVLLCMTGYWLTDYQTGESASTMMDSTAWILGAVLKFGLVLLLIYGAAILFRRWQLGSINRSDRRMKVIESTALSPRRAIFLVQVDGQTFMLGATDQSVNLISEIGTLKGSEAVPIVGFAESFAKAGERLDSFQVR